MSDRQTEKLTIEELEKELEEFKKEKERVRKIVGKIGGHENKKIFHSINILFLLIVVFIFVLGIFQIIDFIISIEIGVLLVSLKIALMIYEQQKVNHFQFWILTSLEYRTNELYKKVSFIEKKLKKMEEEEKK